MRPLAIATPEPEDPTAFSPLLAELSAAGVRPPFVPIKRFVPTGFAKRLIAVLEHSLATGKWMLVTAMSGDGKSTALAEFRRRHPATVKAGPADTTVGVVPVVSTRISRGVQSADSLMHALAAGLGAPPRLGPGAFRVWLVEAIARADVRVIVIDDAHEMTMAQLSYLRELTGQLAEIGSEPAVILLAAVDSTDPRTCKPWTMIARKELVAEQFNNRLDGADPVVFIEGLSRSEVGQVLATWEHLYRIHFPELELAKWTSSTVGWLTDPRNDRVKTGRIRMRQLRAGVNAALAVAWAERRAGLRDDGSDLYAAFVRLTVRGFTVAVVPAADD